MGPYQHGPIGSSAAFGFKSLKFGFGLRMAHNVPIPPMGEDYSGVSRMTMIECVVLTQKSGGAGAFAGLHTFFKNPLFKAH